MIDMQRTKQGAHTVLGLLALGAAFALPTTAHAGRSITAATVCEHWPDPGNAPATAIKYSQFGRLENGSSEQRLTVLCPILRQNASAHLNWVKVYIRDRKFQGGTIGQLTCTLRSNNAWGTNFVELQGIATDAAGGRQNAGFTFHNVDSAATDGSYVLQCSIPPIDAQEGASSIGSIVIDEPN